MMTHAVSYFANAYIKASPFRLGKNHSKNTTNQHAIINCHLDADNRSESQISVSKQEISLNNCVENNLKQSNSNNRRLQAAGVINY